MDDVSRLILASVDVVDGDLTVGRIAWQLVVILFFVFLNGFFVAAEFAIVKVRPSQLDALVDEGSVRAVIARHVTQHLDAYLSATQLGITLSSLALGWIGEPYLANMLTPAFDQFGVGEELRNTIAFVIAFSVITFLHIVLGELMPKSLAIRKSVGTTLFVARPLKWFHFLFRGPIFVLNGCANKLLKVFFKIDPVGEFEMLHSAEELRLLVQQTEHSEEVTPTEREILINALALNDLHVRDVLTPRSEVISLDINRTFDENLTRAIESGHTRFPLVDGHLDHTLGLIHIKDVVRLMTAPDRNLEPIMRPVPNIPEMMALDDLLKVFQKEQVHLAVVVDEFGGTLGIVTLDNVIEELVGDIQDEFDRAEDEREFYRISDDEFIVEGTLPLYELAEHSDLYLESPDVSTIGGYVTHLIGRLPEEGESALVEGWEATVTQTDGKSVGRLRFRRLPPEEAPGQGGDEAVEGAPSGADSSASGSEREPVA